MTQGQYRRCEQKGCRKKVAKHGLCPDHYFIRIEKICEQNPSLAELIIAICDARMFAHEYERHNA